MARISPSRRRAGHAHPLSGDESSDYRGEGWEPQWLTPTDLVFWREGYTFLRVEINTGSDGGIGEPREWFSDPRFDDTPGQSYTISPAGGVVYLQGPERRRLPIYA